MPVPGLHERQRSELQPFGNCEYAHVHHQDHGLSEPKRDQLHGKRTIRASASFPGRILNEAPNFNPTATVSDGSCQAIKKGCTDNRADNYNAVFNVDDGSCRIAGCTSPGSPNYDNFATYNVPCPCSSTCTAPYAAGRRLGEAKDGNVASAPCAWP